MNSEARPALVTGGCGFVGRHVTRRLLAEGYTVWLVDDLSSGRHPDGWLPFPPAQRETQAPGVLRYGPNGEV